MHVLVCVIKLQNARCNDKKLYYFLFLFFVHMTLVLTTGTFVYLYYHLKKGLFVGCSC